MRKYWILLALVPFLLCIFLAFYVRRGRDDLHLEIKNETGEDTYLKDLSYSYHVSLDGKQWEVKGNGTNLTSQYIGEREVKSTYAMITAQPILNEKEILNTSKERSSEGMEQEPIYVYEAQVTALDYRLHYTYQDKDGKERDNVFPKPIHVQAPANESFVCIYDKLENGAVMMRDIYSYEEDVEEDEEAEDVVMQTNDANNVLHDMTYVYVSEGMLSPKLRKLNISMDKSAGGLYQINRDGEMKQLYTMDMNKENILSLVIYQNTLVAMVEKENKHYLYEFDEAGKLKTKTYLPEIIKFHAMTSDGKHVLIKYVGKDELTGNANFIEIYQKQANWKVVDRFNLLVDVTDGKMKYKDHKIYIIERNEFPTIRVMDEVGVLYEGSITMFNKNAQTSYDEQESKFDLITKELFFTNDYPIVSDLAFN